MQSAVDYESKNDSISRYQQQTNRSHTTRKTNRKRRKHN